MFDKFGEFDSHEELNRAAAAQLKEGDDEALMALAQENGIDEEDVNGCLWEAGCGSWGVKALRNHGGLDHLYQDPLF